MTFLEDEQAELAEMRQRSTEPGGTHDWKPRVCHACGYPIWPWERRHRVRVVYPEVGTRFIHYGRCPDAPREFSGPVDKAFVAIAWAFAAVILSALWFAVGYQW